MSRWTQLAKSRFSIAPQEPAPKTPDTPVLGVLGVDPHKKSENSVSSNDAVKLVDEEAIEERAAIMEFDGGLERDQAELLAQAHTRYLYHHWSCPVCCAAGHGRGARCDAGATLWADYQDAESVIDAARKTSIRGGK